MWGVRAMWGVGDEGGVRGWLEAQGEGRTSEGVGHFGDKRLFLQDELRDAGQVRGEGWVRERPKWTKIKATMTARS